MPRKSKNAKKEKSIKEIQAELEANIKEQKKLPKDVEYALNKKVFINIIIAIIVMVYLLFVNIGSINIDSIVFIKDLKVFSIMLIVLTIILFEYSYKKDNGVICINGIEVLVLAIITLLFPSAYVLQNRKFNLIVASVSFLFGAYYVGKSIIIYVRDKKRYFKETNEINRILE